MSRPFSRVIEAVAKLAQNMGSILSNTGDRMADALEAIAVGFPEIKSGDKGKVLAVNDDENGFALVSGGGGSNLPAVTSEDNGKALGVVSGAWNKMDLGYKATFTPGESIEVITSSNTVTVTISVDDGEVSGYVGEDPLGSVCFEISRIPTTGDSVSISISSQKYGEAFTDLSGFVDGGVFDGNAIIEGEYEEDFYTVIEVKDYEDLDDPSRKLYCYFSVENTSAWDDGDTFTITGLTYTIIDRTSYTFDDDFIGDLAEDMPENSGEGKIFWVDATADEDESTANKTSIEIYTAVESNYLPVLRFTQSDDEPFFVYERMTGNGSLPLFTCGCEGVTVDSDGYVNRKYVSSPFGTILNDLGDISCTIEPEDALAAIRSGYPPILYSYGVMHVCTGIGYNQSYSFYNFVSFANNQSGFALVSDDDWETVSWSYGLQAVE